MKYLLSVTGLVTACLFQLISFGQSTEDVHEVTPAEQLQIRSDVEKKVPAFRKLLADQKENQVVIEFSLDTFRLGRFEAAWLHRDYSDAGMREAIYTTARSYDSLMNKYYKKLLGILKGDDKNILQQAQRAWLAFRDNELKLVGTISKDEYSGGGTLQLLMEASVYEAMVKDRTVTLFGHYTRATKSE